MTDKQSTYSAAWFEQILDAMSDMVLVKGPKSRLLWAKRMGKSSDRSVSAAP